MNRFILANTVGFLPSLGDQFISQAALSSELAHQALCALDGLADRLQMNFAVLDSQQQFIAGFETELFAVRRWYHDAATFAQMGFNGVQFAYLRHIL